MVGDAGRAGRWVGVGASGGCLWAEACPACSAVDGGLGLYVKAVASRAFEFGGGQEW